MRPAVDLSFLGNRQIPSNRRLINRCGRRCRRDGSELQDGLTVSCERAFALLSLKIGTGSGQVDSCAIGGVLVCQLHRHDNGAAANLSPKGTKSALS
jgi:hypothetical protein